MTFKELLTEIRSQAFEPFADEYFRILALSSKGCADIAPSFAVALMGTPYSVKITESGDMMFQHVSGHLVTAAASSVRREFVAAVPPMREFGFTQGRRL